jgi:uncharacterized protein YndB with AHSA1/START domain
MTARVDPPGDRARVSVMVAVDRETAFRIFTEEIDQWWRRGLKYRVAGTKRGFIRLEGGVGGRVFESFDGPSGTRIVETGKITSWEPPSQFAFEWRAVNFTPAETTLVEVVFESQRSGTLVTVTHRGWSAIRADHPARHGLDCGGVICWARCVNARASGRVMGDDGRPSWT